VIFSGTDWTVVGAQVLGAVGVVGGVVAYLKKRFPKEVQAVENTVAHDVPAIALQGVEDAAKFVEHIVASPLFAGIAAKGKVEAHHVLDKLTQTTAVSEAKTVLLAIGKVYDALSDTEKLKAEVTLKLALSGIGISMTDKQIQGVFAEAQKAIDAARLTPMFKASFTPDPAVDPAATTQSA